MKRLWDVLVLMLAINFLALVGGVAWLFQSGHLDKDRITKTKELLFPPPSTQPTTMPSSEPTTRPGVASLEELLSKQTSMTAGQQVEFIRQTFDTQMAQLDRRARELGDLKTQIDLANSKLATDRAALDVQRKKLVDEQERARKLAGDQGFQDSLNLYQTMVPSQVKTIFMKLPDEVMIQYLRAMEPRTAKKIVTEFKTPEEMDRIHRVLELMRVGEPTTREARE